MFVIKQQLTPNRLKQQLKQYNSTQTKQCEQNYV